MCETQTQRLHVPGHEVYLDHQLHQDVDGEYLTFTLYQPDGSTLIGAMSLAPPMPIDNLLPFP